jgi:ribonuclease P protein component
VKQYGKTFAHPLIVLKIYRNDLERSRFCVITGNSIGKAVQRNHVKRRLRAAFDNLSEKIDDGWDVLVIARSPIKLVKYREISSVIESLLTNAGLVSKDE